MRIKTNHLPQILNVAHAETIFNKRKPWRNPRHGNENARPLDNFSRNKKHMALVKHEDGSYSCRLYETDLIRYHADGRITITAYPTQSSVAFVNSILPSGLSVAFYDDANVVHMYHYDEANYVFADGQFYQIGEQVTVRKDEAGAWVIVDLNDTLPWVERVISRAAYRKALASVGYYEFLTWHKAARALNGAQLTPLWMMPSYAKIMEVLKGGPEAWTEHNLWHYPEAPKYVRNAVKVTLSDEVYHSPATYQYLTSWQDVHRLRRQQDI